MKLIRGVEHSTMRCVCLSQVQAKIMIYNFMYVKSYSLNAFELSTVML